MILSLKPVADPASLKAPPQRQRVIIIGATPAGMSAAFHIGEHSLLLERRADLENCHDCSNDFPLGIARVRTVGAEDGAADGQRPGVSRAERKALFISCSSQSETGPQDHTLIHVARWQPPVLTQRRESPSVRMLAPLLRGELKFGAWVVRITPSRRHIELADGTQFIYDKLVCTQSLASLARLVMQEIPGRVRHDESLRYWLMDHDIEMADRASQETYGDLDGFAAGKRLADQIGDALAEKFRRVGDPRGRTTPLFEPRLVQAAPAMP